MTGKTYFLVIAIGVVAGLVLALGIGLYSEEINSNGILGTLTFVLFIYVVVCHLLLLVDAYVKFGWLAILIAILLSWTGPLLPIAYITHVYLEATEDVEDQTHA